MTVSRKNKCQTCETVLVLDEKYDAYMCLTCNEWAEGACPDEACEFCSDRPKAPQKIVRERKKCH